MGQLTQINAVTVFILSEFICGLTANSKTLGYGFSHAGYHGSMCRHGITRVTPGFVLGEAVQYRKLKEKFQCKEEFGHKWWETIKRKLDGCAGYLQPLLLLLLLVKHRLFARCLWAPSLLIISFHCQNSSIRLVLLTHPYHRRENWGKKILSSLFEAVQVVGGIAGFGST